jgi:hypothetical protein
MNLVDRAKRIILTPKTEWTVIAGEEANIAQIFKDYVLPLAMIPAIASLVGFGFIGLGFAGSLRWGIAMGLIQFASAFLGTCLCAFVADLLAPNFDSKKNLGKAVQLVAYSYTPAWVAGVFLLFPALGILSTVASLYGLYLLYLGLPHMMKTPEVKVVTYLIVLIVAVIVIYVVISFILSSVILRIFGLSALYLPRGM